MTINMQITTRLDRQIDGAMTRNLLQHVVEKSNASCQTARTAAVEIDRDANLRFLGVAFDLSAAMFQIHVAHLCTKRGPVVIEFRSRCEVCSLSDIQ